MILKCKGGARGSQVTKLILSQLLAELQFLKLPDD